MNYSRVFDLIFIIAAVFMEGDAPMGIKHVEISLDSGKFLSALVEQVRILVLKAVASATKTSVPLPTENGANGQQAAAAASIRQSPDTTSQRSLSTFRSMLNLNPKNTPSTRQSPALMKAQTSALRLNSVLHGDKSIDPSSAGLGMRKNRSVHWDSPGTVSFVTI